jgi:hypothetical protein
MSTIRPEISTPNNCEAARLSRNSHGARMVADIALGTHVALHLGRENFSGDAMRQISFPKANAEL